MTARTGRESAAAGRRRLARATRSGRQPAGDRPRDRPIRRHGRRHHHGADRAGPRLGVAHMSTSTTTPGRWDRATVAGMAAPALAAAVLSFSALAGLARL